MLKIVTRAPVWNHVKTPSTPPFSPRGTSLNMNVCVHSAALGQGWRLGFLGLLHMDVFCQRLEQEHDANVIITTPSVPYKGESESLRKLRKITLVYHPSIILRQND